MAVKVFAGSYPEHYEPNSVWWEMNMGTYTLKSIGKSTDYMTVVREMDDGYVVRIVRDKDGYEDVTTDYISKALFESCIRTGYLTKVEQVEKLAVNA